MTGPVSPRVRRPCRARLLAATLVLLGGCSTSGTSTGMVELVLVVPDNHVRAEGVECAGARPYRHVHQGAPFTVETDDGAVLVEGELPAGRAHNADPSIDWGVERIPTVCVMELRLGELPAHPRYQLRLEQGRPLPFDAAALAAEEPVALVLP